MDANGIKVLVDLLTLAHLHITRATVPTQVKKKIQILFPVTRVFANVYNLNRIKLKFNSTLPIVDWKVLNVYFGKQGRPR